MKNHRFNLFTIGLIAAIFATQSASAVTFYWDADGATTAATGGNGTWDAATSLWRSTSATGTLGAWANTAVNTDTVNLAGTAGTLTLNTSSVDINVNKIIFGTTGYTIAAPVSGTAKLNLAGTTPTIDSGTGTTAPNATISAVITGTAGLTKINTGLLTLSNAANSFSGDISIQNGTLGITTSLGTAGTNSVLGSGYNINLGSTTTTGAIRISPAADTSSNKTINLAGSTGSGNITMAPSVSAASLTLSGAITATSAGAKSMSFSTSGSNTANFIASGLISDGTSAAVTVRLNGSGNGSLVLSNTSNTFSGGITIDGNTASKLYDLSTAAIGNSGSASPLGTGGTIRIGSATSGSTNRLTYSGAGETTDKVIDLYGAVGTASIFNSGGGALKFTSNFTATGAGAKIVTFDGGSGSVEVAGAIVDNSLTNTTGVKKGGNGVLILSGSNTFTGVTNVNQGVLRFTNGALNTTSAIQFTSTGTLQWATGNTQDVSSKITMVNAATTTIDTNSNDVALASNIGSSTSGVFTKTGLGMLTLSGTNTYTGGTTVTQGTLKFTNASALGSSGTIRLSSGTLQWGTGLTTDLSSRFSLTAGSFGTIDTNGNNVTFANAVAATGAGNGGLIKAGSGMLSLTAASTYSLGTTLTGGTLRFTSGALGSGAVTGNGGTLQWAPGNTSDISSVFAMNAATTTTLDTNGNNVTFATGFGTNTLIKSTGSLTKAGTGTLTLSGANTYTGATLINGGTLALGSAGSIDSASEISLGTAGTFDVSAKSGYTVGTLKGSGNVTGALSVSTLLAIGNSPGMANFSSDLTLGAGSTYTYELVGSSTVGGAYTANTADLGNITGNLTITAGSILDLVQLGTYTANDKFTLFSYTGTETGTFTGLADDSKFTAGGGEWLINYNDTLAGANGGTGTSFVTVTAVPEPDAATLVGGLGVLALLRRRRAKA